MTEYHNYLADAGTNLLGGTVGPICEPSRRQWSDPIPSRVMSERWLEDERTAGPRMMRSLAAIVVAVVLIVSAAGAWAQTTRCTTFGGTVRCTTSGGGQSVTTRCTTFGNTTRCTTW